MNSSVLKINSFKSGCFGAGTLFRLKGAIMNMSFLDYQGALIPYEFELWRDLNNKEPKDKERQNKPKNGMFNLV